MSCSPPRFHGEAPFLGRSTENGLEEPGGEDEEEEDLEDEVDSARLEKFMRDRRRARSLPAYPAALLDPESGRKRVKFADSMGLTLAWVRHFSIQEDPQIPVKVLSRHSSFPPQLQSGGQTLRTSLDADRLVTCFPELRDVDRRVRELRVCLERVIITHFDVRGHIRVLRDGSPVDVGVRYTFNDWQSYVDAQALPVAADDPGLVGERFSFTVYTPPTTDPRSAVHFAVYLRSVDGDFWDNNDAHNYTLRYRASLSAALHDT
ncbi:protein phosphatase 1 regulatory subunit 3G [Xenentodon cancila]